jgi:3-oxoacyl-[acyl-carrier protein] reductase
MMDFSGRVLLLTGASGGIDHAITQGFYDARASVLVADIRDGEIREFARSLDPSGTRIATLKYDANRAADANAAVRLCVDLLSRLDYLVPAAAIDEDQ